MYFLNQVFMIRGRYKIHVVFLCKIINDKLRELTVKYNILFELTVSIGVAKSVNNDTLKNLILRADEAMYMEKKATKR